MSVYIIYVCVDCIKTVKFNVSTRKTEDNLDKFNARLLDLKKASSDLISLAICHDEDGWCQIPINSFLLEVKVEGVLGSS